jgi:hypothetical protein
LTPFRKACIFTTLRFVKTHALRLSRTKNLHFAVAPFPRFSALGFHFNASLAALNLLRLEDRQQSVEGSGCNVISIASWKTRKFNAHLLKKFSCHLGLDFTVIKSRPDFAALCNYGAIAA